MSLDDAALILCQRQHGGRLKWHAMTESHRDLYREDAAAALAAAAKPGFRETYEILRRLDQSRVTLAGIRRVVNRWADDDSISHETARLLAELLLYLNDWKPEEDK